MEETKELFLVRFGGWYKWCLCWDCEASLSAIEEVNNEDGGAEGFESALWSGR